MGLFNIVDIDIVCPFCNKKFIPKFGWQTKDKLELYPTILSVKEVNNFYTECTKCGMWIEFNRKEGKFILDRNHSYNKGD